MKTCSFFGHRDTKETPELNQKLRQTIIRLIEENDVQVFLFGSASRFDDLCLKIVTEIKNHYPKVKRIYFRSHFPHISEQYRKYLLESYDETFMPSKIEYAGRASYVERNQAMINESDFCVFYFDENFIPALKKQSRVVSVQPKSGTKLAYDFALKKNKKIINLFG